MKKPANQLIPEDSARTAQTSDSIVVVCAADDQYAMPLAVTIRSAIENLKGDRKIALFIIDGGIKERNKRRILESWDAEKCTVSWIPSPDHLFGEIEVNRQPTYGDVPVAILSIATYYRILIPELLPKDLKKAIYLDSDLAVVGDLGELWDIDVKDNYLLAAQEFLTPYVSSPLGLVNYRELGFSEDSKYFTPGVLVFNLEKCRADNLCARCIKYLHTHREFIRWHDSDVLNAVIAGEWGQLHPKWNQMSYIYDCSSWKDTGYSEEVFNEALNHPLIVHFAKPSKPWNSREKHPLQHLFFHYLDMTAWSGWRLTIWRRLQRRLSREIKQFKNLILQKKAV